MKVRNNNSSIFNFKRNMKHYLLNFAAYLTGLILLIFIIIFILSENHEFKPSPKYNYKEFNNAFTNKDNDLIAIGNSKLLASLDKSILQNGTNFKSAILGYSESNISVSRLTLEAYLDKCIKKPKIVLFEVSWFSFNSKRTGLKNITGDLQLKDLSLFKYFFRYGRKSSNNYFQALKKQILYAELDTSIIFGNHGRRNITNKKNYKFDLLTFNKIFPTHFAGSDNVLKEDFNSIVSLCKKNDIELILYTAPEDKEYSLAQKDRNVIKKVFNDLSLLNETIIYLDYSLGGELYDEKFEYWLADSHHIYNNELFTKKLVKDIKKARTHNNGYE